MTARRWIAVLALVLAVPAAAPAAPVPAEALPAQGPDHPVTTEPIAQVVAFDDERFAFTESRRRTTIDVPTGWDRVFVTYRSAPDGDPWDRLFGVSIEGVEVLRGTTPRTDFTVREEITEYAALLPAGGEADVATLMSTWVGAMRVWVSLEFYAEDGVEQAAGAVVPVIEWAYLRGHDTTVTGPASFEPATPGSAIAEITLTGHGDEEFWYTTSGRRPRTFHLSVDGVEIATARSFPYVYALLGFSGSTGDLVHGPMWWTAQRAADQAGVHGGVGEIPSYRAIVDAEHLPLLTGERTITVRQELGSAGFWVTSVAFLVED